MITLPSYFSCPYKGYFRFTIDGRSEKMYFLSALSDCETIKNLHMYLFS